MFNIKKSLCLFFILIVFQVNSQIKQEEKDSILSIINSQNNIEKMGNLNKLFNFYITKNIDSAKFYAEQLNTFSLKKHNSKYIAISYINIGVYFFKNGNFLQAKNNYKLALEIYKDLKLEKEIAETYKKLSRTCYYNNNLSESIDYTQKSLYIFEKINDKQGIIEAYSNLGSLYGVSGNSKKALKYYFSILKKNNSIPKKLKLKLYHNIGSQYKRLNISDSALFYYKKSLIISQKNNFINDIASNYYSIGDFYGTQINKPDSAIIYLNKALNLLKSNNINLQKAIYATIGKTYFENNEYSQSIKALKKSLEISEKLQNLNGKEVAHFFLYKSYKRTGKLKNALYHHEKYIEAKDSIKYEEANIKIENLESKFENEKNKLIIEKLELKNETDKKIKKLLVIGIILSLLVFGLIIRSLILKRKKNILEKELLKTEKEKLNQDLQHKTRELTSQTLMMLQKNKLLEEISKSLSEIKTTGSETHKELIALKRRLKYSMHSEKDWELFKQYFEEINKNFFTKLNRESDKITPAEMKMAALIKLRFSIKETASLLNISDGSVKTSRYNLRKKLGLKREDNIYDFLSKF